MVKPEVLLYPKDPELWQALSRLDNLPEWGKFLKWLASQELAKVARHRGLDQSLSVEALGLEAARLQESLKIIEQIRNLPKKAREVREFLLKKGIDIETNM